MLSDRLAVCELLLLADEVPGGVRQRGQPRLRHVHLAREAQDDRVSVYLFSIPLILSCSIKIYSAERVSWL